MGLISWALGVLVSVPITALLGQALPRELVPLYRPATPPRVLDALQRALAPPSADSARMDLDAGAAGHFQVTLVGEIPPGTAVKVVESARYSPPDALREKAAP